MSLPLETGGLVTVVKVTLCDFCYGGMRHSTVPAWWSYTRCKLRISGLLLPEPRHHTLRKAEQPMAPRGSQPSAWLSAC